MKLTRILIAILMLFFLFTACNTPQQESAETDATQIILNDNRILINNIPATTDKTAAVYTANDIVYYESGKDFTYGEGTQKDTHSPEEAAIHTVVHITKPGDYSISGKLSKGQIAVDLGENAVKDPNAVVTLILNGLDITCEVAPAVIFYNVYECGSTDTEKATKDVDTSAAGANVIIADGTENSVNGSYVERIYKPDSVILNADGTEVEDAKKLHKYDGAFYSKMSMNINGGPQDTGILNINAENEGLDSELHLTLNGGNINIKSGNDGINTNADGISVTAVNGGTLSIQVTGETGEGDGIDSNGWLVINGGNVLASACSNSADAGIDSDLGIHINGGTVIATGHMLDRIEDGGQTYAVFNFTAKQTGSEIITLKNEANAELLAHRPQNAYSILVYSGPALIPGSYSLYSNETQLSGQSGSMHGIHPGGVTPPEGFENMQPPQGEKPPFNEMEPPEGNNRPDKPDGEKSGEQRPGTPFAPGTDTALNLSAEFIITQGGNMFSGVSPYKEETT